jgi:alcohol dehydrogenase class IV
LHSVLREAGLAVESLARATREPTVEDVDQAVATARRLGAGSGDLLLAVGGGSAIDLAKAIAGLCVQEEPDGVCAYLEGVGVGKNMAVAPLPVVAVPTTAGTGSEATRNAVISSSNPPFKKSLRDPRLFPSLVVVDPELTGHCPPHVTAHSGMDAVTQLIESIVSKRARPIPTAVALSGLEGSLDALEAAAADGPRWARERMSHAALLSGMALANSGLGFAHGVAAALGAIAGTTHGLACAVMLPAAIRLNRDVAREPLAHAATAATGRTFASQDEAVVELTATIEALSARLGIPCRLTAVGVTPGQIPALVAASRGNSMDGNPRPISDDELSQVLEEML